MPERILNNIRERRDDHGQMTQQALADLTGVSRQTINAIETGRYTPSLPLALKIAQVFQQPVEEIFSISSTP